MRSLMHGCIADVRDRPVRQELAPETMCQAENLFCGTPPSPGSGVDSKRPTVADRHSVPSRAKRHTIGRLQKKAHCTSPWLVPFKISAKQFSSRLEPFDMVPRLVLLGRTPSSLGAARKKDLPATPNGAFRSVLGSLVEGCRRALRKGVNSCLGTQETYHPFITTKPLPFEFDLDAGFLSVNSSPIWNHKAVVRLWRVRCA
jgi:hypothetical protein